MVDQGLEFDPKIHHMPPPLRDGLAQQPPPQPRPAPPPQPQPRWQPPEPIQHIQPAYIATARAIGQIIATRILMLICVLTSSAIWGVAVWTPSDGRTMAATAFSMVTMWPLTLLYWKKG